MLCEVDDEMRTKSLTSEVGFMLGRLMQEVPPGIQFGQSCRGVLFFCADQWSVGWETEQVFVCVFSITR
jgi:hypothetical protein